MRMILMVLAVAVSAAVPAAAQEKAVNSVNRIDLVRPDAPELAPYGNYAVGVRTLDIVSKGQVDILKVEAGKDLPLYNRKLVAEVWYPAETAVDQRGTYDVFLRDGKTRVKLSGRAAR